ncbi:hypothetical protein [Oleidesulfovibrio sp.]|uniref:hypothetical protein n=1 Tax=Oleidesulfovibrio sp. TaxID=2909707 RepID=UPI003A8364F6
MNQKNIEQIVEMISEDFRSIYTSMEELERNDDGSFIVPDEVLVSMVGVLQNVVAGLQKAQSEYAIRRYQNALISGMGEDPMYTPAYSNTEQ